MRALPALFVSSVMLLATGAMPAFAQTTDQDQTKVEVHDMAPTVQVTGTLRQEGSQFTLLGDDGSTYTLINSGEEFQVNPATGALTPVGPRIEDMSPLAGKRVAASGILTASTSPTTARPTTPGGSATGKILKLVDLKPAQ